jgi:hypothetical protein
MKLKVPAMALRVLEKVELMKVLRIAMIMLLMVRWLMKALLKVLRPMVRARVQPGWPGPGLPGWYIVKGR